LLYFENKEEKTKDCDLDGSKYTNKHCRSNYCYILRIKKEKKNKKIAKCIAKNIQESNLIVLSFE